MTATKLINNPTLAWISIFVLLAGCTTISQERGARTTEIPLAQIQNISPDVLAVQDRLFHIEDPVPYSPDDSMYLFTVSLAGYDWSGNETEYEFAGNTTTIDHFRKEVKFVNERHGGVGEQSVRGFEGAKDDVEAMAKGLIDLVFHPIEVAQGLEKGGVEAIGYIRTNYNNPTQLQKVLSQFLAAYEQNTYMQTATNFDLNYMELQTQEAKDAVERLGKAQIKGTASVEILTLLVSFVKFGKISEVVEIGDAVAKAGKASDTVNGAEKLTGAGRWGKFFEYGAKAEQGATRMSQAESFAKKISALARIFHS